MSLARWGCDDSDVYVYEAAEGFTCAHTSHPSFVGTATEMLTHLDRHMRGDQHVPPHTLAELRDEAAKEDGCVRALRFELAWRTT